MSISESITFNALALLTLVALSIYWYYRKIYSYWKDRNVVSLPTVPILGSQLEILRVKRHRSEWYAKIYNQHSNEKMVGGFKGNQPELIVRDAEIVKMILVKDFNHFQDRSLPNSELNMLSQNLFEVKGEKWRLLRQKLTPTFTSSKIKKMFPLIVECGQSLQEYLKTAVKRNDVHEVRDIMAKFTTDTIGSCAFGMNMQSMKDEDSPFREIGKKAFQSSKIIVWIEYAFYLMPTLLNMIPLKVLMKSYRDVEVFLLGLIKQLIQTRRGTPSHRHDFIDLMMELQNKEMDSINEMSQGGILDMTDELITAQAYVFFLAGFETSSTLMSYVLHQLALHPNIQETLLKEIDTVLEKYDGKLTYDAIQEMEYLEMIMNETLRKHPPLAFLSRECTAKYTIPGTHVTIDKGVNIIVPTVALHYDPQHFPDPEEFNPERFNINAEKTYHPFSYLPFGDGPRNCIGLRFGKLQTATGLISVLTQYSVESCEKTKRNIELDPASFVTSSPVEGIWLRLRSRKSGDE